MNKTRASKFIIAMISRIKNRMCFPEDKIWENL